MLQVLFFHRSPFKFSALIEVYKKVKETYDQKKSVVGYAKSSHPCPPI
jgi:hypothetical protein